MAAVAERLFAAPEGMHALASEQAVAIIPKLSRDQLTLLAVIAFFYSIRPRALDVIDGGETNTERLSSEERAAVVEYVNWLRRTSESLDLAAEPELTDIAHLASTGCLLYERHLRRDFRKILSPFGRRFVVAADSAAFDDLVSEWARQSKALGELNWYWDEIVQHTLLTPVGLLVGVAVFDEQAGEETDLASVQRIMPDYDPIIEHPIWNGRRIDLRFLDALSSAVIDAAQRGVRPWCDFVVRR